VLALSGEAVTAFGAASDATHFWAEKCEFWGYKCFSHFPTAATNTARVTLVDCGAGYTRHAYAIASDAVFSDGFAFGSTANVRLLRCQARECLSGDGIAVFATIAGSGTPPIRNRILTLRCKGYDNGTREGINDNGYTCHNGATAGIDVGSDWGYNYGPNTIHISSMIMLDVYAHHSLGAGTASQDFCSSGVSSTNFSLWLMKNCTAGGSTDAIARGGFSQIIELGGNDFTSGGLAGGTTLVDGTDAYQLAIATIAPQKLNGWYDFIQRAGSAHSYALTASLILSFADMSAAKKNLSTTASFRHTYSASVANLNGLRGLTCGTVANNNYCTSVSNTIKEFWLLGNIAGGAASTSAIAARFMANASGVKRVALNGSTGDLESSVNTVASTASINGAGFSATIMPSGTCAVIRIVLDTAQTDTFRYLGDSFVTGLGFLGDVAAFYTFAEDLTVPEAAAFLTTLKARGGIA